MVEVRVAKRGRSAAQLACFDLSRQAVQRMNPPEEQHEAAAVAPLFTPDLADTPATAEIPPSETEKPPVTAETEDIAEALVSAGVPSIYKERVRVRKGGSARDANKATFVLYVVRTALRAHENPALEVAKHLASYYGLPVLAYAPVEQKGT